MSMNCCGGRLTWCTITRRAGVRRACARPRWQPRRGVPPRSRHATPPPYCDVSHGERAPRQYMREQARMQACLCARAERRDLARSNARELCLADQLRTVTNHAAVADLRDAWQSWRREVTLLALEANVKRIVGRNLRCGARHHDSSDRAVSATRPRPAAQSALSGRPPRVHRSDRTV